MDNEVKGVGNYKYRMHDPRLGRFFAVDPLTSKYPFYSPYAFSGNRVIDKVELEGLEPAEPGPEEGDTQSAPFKTEMTLEIKIGYGQEVIGFRLQQVVLLKLKAKEVVFGILRVVFK
jgi:hypothetical protein